MKQPERRAATRNAIIDAAEKLFADKGVEAVTIDDIVAQAAVARGSFYYNFASKEHVVLAIGRRDFGRVAAKLDTRLARGESPSLLLRELLSTTCRWYRRNRHLARTLLLSSLEQAPPAADLPESPSFRKLTERIMQRAQDVGEIRRDFAPSMLAEITVGMFLQAALFWIHAAKPGRLDHWVDRCLTVFLEGAQSRQESR
jgi:AcrR family transcriptional regulator